MDDFLDLALERRKDPVVDVRDPTLIQLEPFVKDLGDDVVLYVRCCVCKFFIYYYFGCVVGGDGC